MYGSICIIRKGSLLYFNYVSTGWVPTPQSFSCQPLFLCKISCQGSTTVFKTLVFSIVLQYKISLTSLIHIDAQCVLHCCKSLERFGLKCEFSLVSNNYVPSIGLVLIPLHTWECMEKNKTISQIPKHCLMHSTKFTN